MFYYTRPSDSKKMCVDASTIPCKCHPERQTLGRLCNHSRNDNNLMPKILQIDDDFNIVLIAKDDLAPNTELLFNYGVDRGEFG